jgi:hypothetical protein
MNDTNWEHEYAGKVIQNRKTDGYINATQLCKAGKRDLAVWNRNKTGKEFVEVLGNKLNMTREQLIESVTSGLNEDRKTWVHPQIATHIAQWISPTFAVKVSAWIEEWKNHSTGNRKKYVEELERLEPTANLSIEKELQRKLQKQLNAQIEVKTPVGYADLLTDTEIIEIKEITNWKSALGQILSYGSFYPTHQKSLYLFNASESKMEPKMDTTEIERICGLYDVKVRYN